MFCSWLSGLGHILRTRTTGCNVGSILDGGGIFGQCIETATKQNHKKMSCY